MSIRIHLLLLLLALLQLSLPLWATTPVDTVMTEDATELADPNITTGAGVDVAGLIERLGYPQHLARGIARFNTSVVQRKLEGVKNRRERQHRLERLQAVAARIEEALSWEQLAPLVQAAWSEHLDDNQLATLTALLETPAGRLYADKGMTALAEAGIDQAIHLDAKIDEVFDRPTRMRPPRLRPVREPAPDSHAGLALRWLRLHEPELAEVFAQRQAKSLADARLVFQGGDPDGAIAPEHQVILDAFEREIRLADLEHIAVQRLTRELSRSELAVLLPVFEPPTMQSLMVARARADRSVGEKAAELVQNELQPRLMIDLMRILMD